MSEADIKTFCFALNLTVFEIKFPDQSFSIFEDCEASPPSNMLPEELRVIENERKLYIEIPIHQCL